MTALHYLQQIKKAQGPGSSGSSGAANPKLSTGESWNAGGDLISSSSPVPGTQAPTTVEELPSMKAFRASRADMPRVSDSRDMPAPTGQRAWDSRTGYTPTLPGTAFGAFPAQTGPKTGFGGVPTAKSAQFPYGPQSLHQHAPEPPPPQPMAPPPPPDPNPELQAQLEQSQAQIQDLAQAQQQADAQKAQLELKVQESQAQAQLAKREAELTRKEMELEHRAQEQQEQTVPHLSPASNERLEAIKKHLDRLTKKASDYLPTTMSPEDQRNWAANQVVQGRTLAQAPAELRPLVEEQAQIMNRPAPRTADGRYDAQWLETGKHPGLQGNWFNRNVANRALNLWRPVAVGGQRMSEHAQAGNYGRAAGSALFAGGRTALNVGFGPLGVGAAAAFDSGGAGAGSQGSTQALAERAEQEMDLKDRARAWRETESGLRDRYQQNVAPLNTLGEGASLQELNMFGPYANLARGAGRGPAFTAQDYSRSRSQLYGDPDTLWGSILNQGLPFLSSMMTGGPRPSYQHGEPFVPGAHLRHTPQPLTPTIGAGI